MNVAEPGTGPADPFGPGDAYDGDGQLTISEAERERLWAEHREAVLAARQRSQAAGRLPAHEAFGLAGIPPSTPPSNFLPEQIDGGRRTTALPSLEGERQPDGRVRAALGSAARALSR